MAKTYGIFYDTYRDDKGHNTTYAPIIAQSAKEAEKVFIDFMKKNGIPNMEYTIIAITPLLKPGIKFTCY